MFRLGSFVAVALLWGTPAHAQDGTRVIDEIFSWATPDTPGCAVAVSRDGDVVVNRAYGSADLEHDVPLTPATRFDVGSLQKQFVAAAVLLLVEEGRLSLSDDVGEHFPELPDYGHTVTVDHLLTHTSGVRDWIPLLRLSRGDEDALTLILRQRGLNFVPGEEWSYSNSGYELLKELVARTTGMSFSEFARRRLFEPLGMESTTYAADIRAAGENGALAYEKEGDRWEPSMMLGNDRGGGAVLATASDLLIWNEALTNASLGAFVTEKLQEPARLNNGRQLDYGRGLILDTYRGGTMVWHTGSADGYKSWLSRYPEQGLSIAMLCNSGDGTDRGMFARRIYDLFVPATAASDTAVNVPLASADNAGAEGIDVNGKAGLFFSEPNGQPLRLIVQGDTLRVAGGPALVPVAPDHFRNPQGSLFFMSDDAFELYFPSPDQLVLESMEGRLTRYRRARPYSPTTDALQAFSGRWESEELNAVFEVTPGERGLVIRLNGSPPRGIEFAPVDTDTFQRGRMTLRFRRDGDGNVVALDYSNPGLRNIAFTQPSDGSSGR